MTQAIRNTHAPALADLGDAITRMDALAQDGFSAVAAIAKRALASLEASSSTIPHPESMADALRAIWSKAEQFGNEVNVKAEQAGCNYPGKR